MKIVIQQEEFWTRYPVGVLGENGLHSQGDIILDVPAEQGRRWLKIHKQWKEAMEEIQQAVIEFIETEQ